VDLKNPYVTRLRTRMLVDHLGDDLELEPADAAGNVYAQRQVPDGNGLNVPVIQCPDWNGDGEPDAWTDWWQMQGEADSNGCAAVGSSGAATSGITIATLGACVALVLLATRRRRRRSERTNDDRQ